MNKVQLNAASLTPLQPVANLCASGSCPTVYSTGDPATVVVQGFAMTGDQAGIDVPEGEVLIRIPRDLLAEAVRNLS
ncbi:hypothetical protein [Actinoplanes sp. NPDC026619]|uniref:hypothetical protein n=1 Tax=Actinoplanes sp. NPDC026619 TaxID=3155798 RepID=UPI0033E12604